MEKFKKTVLGLNSRSADVYVNSAKRMYNEMNSEHLEACLSLNKAPAQNACTIKWIPNRKKW